MATCCYTVERALAAIGVTYVLSRRALLGPRDAVGWLLVAVIAVAMVVSVRRAIVAQRGPVGSGSAAKGSEQD